MSFDELLRDPDRFLAYSGEAILKSRPLLEDQPDCICLYLEPSPDGHPFARYKAGALESADKFFMVAFQIDEHGEPIDQELKLRLTRALKSGIKQANRSKWVQAAGALCRDRKFHRFVQRKVKKMSAQAQKEFRLELPRKFAGKGAEVLDGPDAEEFTVNWVRYQCKIRSRAELGFNREGTQRFQGLREEYYVHLFDSDGES